MLWICTQTSRPTYRKTLTLCIHCIWWHSYINTRSHIYISTHPPTHTEHGKSIEFGTNARKRRKKHSRKKGTKKVTKHTKPSLTQTHTHLHTKIEFYWHVNCEHLKWHNIVTTYKKATNGQFSFGWNEITKNNKKQNYGNKKWWFSFPFFWCINKIYLCEQAFPWKQNPTKWWKRR